MIKITIALLVLVGCVTEPTELPPRPQLAYPVVATGIDENGAPLYLITAAELERLREQTREATDWMRTCDLELRGEVP